MLNQVKLTAKQYLDQGYLLNELIDANVEELKRLESMIDGLSGIAYDKDPVQSGCITSPVERTLEKLERFKNKINAENDRYVDLKEEIRDCIEALPNPKEKVILRLRYVLFKSWDEIGDILQLKRTQVFSLHQTALNHFIVPDSKISFRSRTKPDENGLETISQSVIE